MTFPRIKTVTIDSHDDSAPLIRIRFVEINGVNFHLVKDVGQHLGLKADDDGDYRSALSELGIPFVDLAIFHRDQPLGPHTLISEVAYNLARTMKLG